MPNTKTVNILGIRGIPASHGGFETFAEHFALYLVKKGWKVRVFCQELGDGDVYESEWNGVELIHIPVSRDGSLGSIFFDFRSVLIAIKRGGVNLTLGYNTAVFSLLFRLAGKKNIMNMDGIEWKREKWSRPIRVWFYLNEWFGSHLANHLVADHPEIKNHLQRSVSGKKITVIPYAAPDIHTANEEILQRYDLETGNFLVVIARPEPENSIYEIVAAYSAHPRSYRLVVLGNYDPNHPYHQSVVAAASDGVLFPGAIYDRTIVEALRFHALCYVHGHRVGGTNPSLVEALGAGSAVIAHDNKYNRWVAGEGAAYFTNQHDCEALMDKLDQQALDITQMKQQSREQKHRHFTWELVHGKYEELLEAYLPSD